MSCKHEEKVVKKKRYLIILKVWLVGREFL